MNGNNRIRLKKMKSSNSINYSEYYKRNGKNENLINNVINENTTINY